MRVQLSDFDTTPTADEHTLASTWVSQDKAAEIFDDVERDRLATAAAHGLAAGRAVAAELDELQLAVEDAGNRHGVEADDPREVACILADQLEAVVDERDDLQVQFEESEAALLRLVEEVTRELRAAYKPYTLPSGQRPAELVAHVCGHMRADHKKTIEAAGAAAADAQRTIEGLRAERELLRGMIVEGMKS